MTLSSFSLVGRVAIVTGARRGIGKAIALGFAEAGADVAVCDNVVEDGELESVVNEIKRLGRQSLSVQADVTRKPEVDNMVKRVTDEFGAIDILVNNAGVYSGYPILETSEEEWNKVINVDLTGCFLCSQAVGKGMVERRRGSIINIASAGGMRAFAGKNAYNVAKAGVIMLTRCLARDWGKYNVRVNAIGPTIVKTDLTRGMQEDPRALAAEEARIPLGRLAEASEIAGPAIFLASDASSYVSGQTIFADGAQLA